MPNNSDNIGSKLMNDWRYRGQEEYLKQKVLIHCKYIKHSEEWEHEHCDFCFATFSELNDDLHEGYCTQDGIHWICNNCFNDFNKLFLWDVKTL